MFVRCDDSPECRLPSDHEAETVACDLLNSLLGIQERPFFSSVFQAPRSLPGYRLGHTARVATIQERIRAYPGLALAGNAYHGHGVTNCLRSAQQAAGHLLDVLQACKSKRTKEWSYASSNG
tara:strand:+ start:106 stop:471 length:366 start_codon:yes stop_codon:yes gene_type:complete